MLKTVDVILESNPTSFDVLKTRVDDLAQKENPPLSGVPRYVRLKKIQHLHFMSLQIFEDPHYDPLLVFENNYDGDCDAYWAAVETEIGDDLRAILACTKPAIEPRWTAVFANGSKIPLADFLKAYSVGPSALHIGATGLTIDRIQRERQLSDDIEAYLGAEAVPFGGKSPAAMHAELRRWALPKYSWLGETEARRTLGEWISYILAAIPWALAVLIPLALLIYLVVELWPVPGLIVLACSLAPLGVLPIVLRHIEKTDLTQENPQLSPTQLATFAKQEDQIVQNHLASMVLVKPGVLRSVAIRVSLALLKRFVPIVAANGYLGSMRTIHFAHWTLVGNQGRLLFLSNFDGSWQSYLDDFVDKAHGGLTLAWTNCVGFPRTRWLVQDGATHGHDFKAWARQSQTVSSLWYSAYPDMTVNQVLRNADVADGLRKRSVSSEEAVQWAKLL